MSQVPARLFVGLHEVMKSRRIVSDHLERVFREVSNRRAAMLEQLVRLAGADTHEIERHDPGLIGSTTVYSTVPRSSFRLYERIDVRGHAGTGAVLFWIEGRALPQGDGDPRGTLATEGVGNGAD